MCKQVEARPVKPQQTAAGAHPKRAVGSLCESLHCFFRQAIL